MNNENRFRLTPDQFEIDETGNLMLDTCQIADVAENAYETFLPEEAGVTVRITIEL